MDAEAFQEDPESLVSIPSLINPEIEKEAGRRKARSQDDRAKCVRVTRRGGRYASQRRNQKTEFKGKTQKKTSRNKFMKKSGMPDRVDRVKNFREDHSNSRQRAQFWVC